MYIFAGRTMDNKKVNDVWKMNLETLEWEEICKPFSNIGTDEYPLERTGHSCDIIGHYMVIFGGLFELTKELNDLYVFDLKNHQWIKIFDDADCPTSPTKIASSRMQKSNGETAENTEGEK